MSAITDLMDENERLRRDEVEMGMLLERLGGVEREARELCRLALTTTPELQSHTVPLMKALIYLDEHPAIAKLRSSHSGEVPRD